MSESYCQHGYRKARHCPQCALPGERGRRRSVYEGRELVSVAEDEPRWTHLGTIDRFTGQASVDYSRVARWRPLSEFLRWR
jgi:hypothetical protein